MFFFPSKRNFPIETLPGWIRVLPARHVPTNPFGVVDAVGFRAQEHIPRPVVEGHHEY